MLTALRKGAQSWIGKVVLGIIAVTFVIAFGVVGNLTNPKEVLVKVDSHEIMVSEFRRTYEIELDRLRQRFPDNAEVLASQLNLRDQVLQRMINRYLMLREADARGLTVTEDELKETLTSRTDFQVDGRFDYETYRQILQQNRLTPADYENQLREDLLLGKHQRNLTAGLIVGAPQIEQRYRIQNERVEVDYIYADPDKVKLAKRPTLEAQQAHYKSHPDRFTQPARFQIRYFNLSLSLLEPDAQVRPRAVERYYQRNLESEFSTPKRVRASHILKRLPQEADADRKAKVRAEMEAILVRARTGEDFAGLARTHSEDLSKERGGDLGFFNRDDMVPEFADAAFSLPAGAISGLVRSPFGLHIIKVTAIEPGEQKSLEEVREEIENKLRTLRAERRLELELERLPARIEKEGLDAVAQSLGAPAITSPFFDGSGVLKGLGSIGPLYGQLKGRRKGDRGVWRRNPVFGHIFYEVRDRKDSFVKSFDQVKSEVARQTAAEQRREAALAQAKSAFKELKAAEDFARYARGKALPVNTVSFTVIAPSIEGIGVNREFQRAAFRLDGDSPFALNIKDGKAYLMRFSRRYFAESENELALKEQIARSMEETLRRYVLDSEVGRLRARSQIDIVAPGYVAGSTAAPRRNPCGY